MCSSLVAANVQNYYYPYQKLLHQMLVCTICSKLSSKLLRCARQTIPWGIVLHHYFYLVNGNQFFVIKREKGGSNLLPLHHFYDVMFYMRGLANTKNFIYKVLAITFFKAYMWLDISLHMGCVIPDYSKPTMIYHSALQRQKVK